jgi:uncharacterized protein involved in exopolysaccharide biosynthesis
MRGKVPETLGSQDMMSSVLSLYYQVEKAREQLSAQTTPKDPDMVQQRAPYP